MQAGAVSEEVKLFVLIGIREKAGIHVDGTDSGTDSLAPDSFIPSPERRGVDGFESRASESPSGYRLLE